MSAKNTCMGKIRLCCKTVFCFSFMQRLGDRRQRECSNWCSGAESAAFVVGKKGNPLEDETSICWEAVDHPYLSAIEYHIPFQVLSYKLATGMGLSTIVANHDFAGAQLKTRIEE